MEACEWRVATSDEASLAYLNDRIELSKNELASDSKVRSVPKLPRNGLANPRVPNKLGVH